MRRSQFGREFKVEAVRLIKDRGVSVAQASRDLDVHENQLRKWVKLKTERIRGRVYRTRDDARSDVFDYIERFYNAIRRHSTIGYISPVEFAKNVGLAYWASTKPAAGHPD